MLAALACLTWGLEKLESPETSLLVASQERSVLGNTDAVEIKDIDIRNYARYILSDGQDMEKRELLGCLRSKISLREKTIYLCTG